jgi:uncharacterized protein (TIGR02145 family)
MKNKTIKIWIYSLSIIGIFLMFLSISYKSIAQESSGIVQDIDGNVYKTVRIGSQIWMAENLKTTHYANGTAIPIVTGNSNWDTLATTSKAYCWYDDDIATNADTYGALYTWSATLNGAGSSSSSPSGIQGVCPKGWHVPSDAEWKTLEMYLGMSQSVADETGERGTDEGGKLKETGTTHWQSLNIGATNESGFTALPGGCRRDNGTFEFVGLSGLWWSSTEGSTDLAWYRHLYYDYSYVYRSIHSCNKQYGFSVRCLRD